jgi:hypothetical protein
MRSHILDVNNCTIKSGSKTYCFDFTVHYEIVNPTWDIYDKQGNPKFDEGKDEVNFVFATVKNGLEMNNKTGDWVGVCWSEHLVLAELALDWCRDNPLMHMEAFKDWKGRF